MAASRAITRESGKVKPYEAPLPYNSSATTAVLQPQCYSRSAIAAVLLKQCHISSAIAAVLAGTLAPPCCPAPCFTRPRRASVFHPRTPLPHQMRMENWCGSATVRRTERLANRRSGQQAECVRVVRSESRGSQRGSQRGVPWCEDHDSIGLVSNIHKTSQKLLQSLFICSRFMFHVSCRWAACMYVRRGRIAIM